MNPYRSAQVVLGEVWRWERFNHPSVVDLGCGSGGWLAAASELGARSLVGIDQSADPPIWRGAEIGSEDAEATARWTGTYVCADLETVEKSSLLAEVLGRGDRKSLCICVEVAEHLRPTCGRHIVDLVTAMSPRVLWSAAVPGQGPYASEEEIAAGIHNAGVHWNEREPSYWQELFAEVGYTLDRDFEPYLRDKGTRGLDPWYSKTRLYKQQGTF